MNRRHFLSTLGLTVGGLPCSLAGAKFIQSEESTGCIKGFIVSDAHIGWKHFQQPTIEEQHQACENIKAKFPDLDLVFDTGDVHHGYLKEPERVKARTQWLDHIANQFSTTPFHYIAGNHELGKGLNDPEQTACQLGSIPLRPYYSFDYKGIHFIALPELFNTIYITQESINWLLLDLLVNQHKTTLIFSHNSIKGTTFNNGETGYRCLANSQQLLDILDKNPQIVAWFHGHNHQYELVKQDNRLFVSNGRIGGFVPAESWGDFGQGHLGGMYFEINQNQLLVRAYSATASAFLDELDSPHLSQSLKMPTSYNAQGPFNYYLGHGASVAGVEHLCANHYLSDQEHQITYSKVNNNINEHAQLDLPTHYRFANRDQVKMIGYKFSDNAIKFKQQGGDLLVLNETSLPSFSLSFPNHLNQKSRLYKRGGYYRYGDINYQVAVALGDLPADAELTLQLKVTFMDDQYQKIYSTAPITAQKTGQLYQFDVKRQTPKPSSPTLRYFRFDLIFNGAPDKLLIQSIHLRPHNNNLKDAVFKYQGQQLQVGEDLIKTKHAVKVASDFQSAIQFNNTGNHVIAWLACMPQVQWQARNATIRKQGDFIELRRSVDLISQCQRMILTPTQSNDFYPNQFVGTQAAKFKLNGSMLDIVLDTPTTESQVVVVAKNGQLSCEQASIKPLGSDQYQLTPTSPQMQVKYVKKT